jgi:DNA-binding NtrC family response regulator
MDAIALVEMKTSPWAGNVRAVAHVVHVHVPDRAKSLMHAEQTHSH